MFDALETKTVAEITALYNAVPGTKPVKKFETKAKAIARYRQALGAEPTAPEPTAPSAEPAAQPTLPDSEVAVLGPNPKATAPSPKPTAPSPKRRAPRAKTSISQRCKELIRDGLTNADVWDVIKDEFLLDDKKKYYPAWNRSWMARHGEKV